MRLVEDRRPTSTGAGPAGRGQASGGHALILAVMVAALDLASKAWARWHLASAGRNRPGLSFGLVRNHGAALGIGSQLPVLVGVLESVGVLAVCWWLWTASTTGQRVCAAIVLGGAAGNLLDRLQHGAVTDWIRVAPYPPYFNLADLAIRGGLIAAALLAASHYLRRRANSAEAVPLKRPATPEWANPGRGSALDRTQRRRAPERDARLGFNGFPLCEPTAREPGHPWGAARPFVSGRRGVVATRVSILLGASS